MGSFQNFFENLQDGVQDNIVKPFYRHQAKQYYKDVYQDLEDKYDGLTDEEHQQFLDTLPSIEEVEEGAIFDNAQRRGAIKGSFLERTGRRAVKSLLDIQSQLLKAPEAMKDFSPQGIAHRLLADAVPEPSTGVTRALAQAGAGIEDVAEDITGVTPDLAFTDDKGKFDLAAAIGTLGGGIVGMGINPVTRAMMAFENPIAQTAFNGLTKAGFANTAKEVFRNKVLTQGLAGSVSGVPLSFGASLDEEGKLDTEQLGVNLALDAVLGGAAGSLFSALDGKGTKDALKAVAASKRALKQRTAQAFDEGFVTKQKRTKAFQDKKLAEQQAKLERQQELVPVREELEAEVKNLDDLYQQRIADEQLKIEDDFTPEFKQIDEQRLALDEQMKALDDGYLKSIKELDSEFAPQVKQFQKQLEANEKLFADEEKLLREQFKKKLDTELAVLDKKYKTPKPKKTKGKIGDKNIKALEEAELKIKEGNEAKLAEEKQAVQTRLEEDLNQQLTKRKERLFGRAKELGAKAREAEIGGLTKELEDVGRYKELNLDATETRFGKRLREQEGVEFNKALEAEEKRINTARGKELIQEFNENTPLDNVFEMLHSNKLNPKLLKQGFDLGDTLNPQAFKQYTSSQSKYGLDELIEEAISISGQEGVDADALTREVIDLIQTDFEKSPLEYFRAKGRRRVAEVVEEQARPSSGEQIEDALIDEIGRKYDIANNLDAKYQQQKQAIANEVENLNRNKERIASNMEQAKVRAARNQRRQFHKEAIKRYKEVTGEVGDLPPKARELQEDLEADRQLFNEEYPRVDQDVANLKEVPSVKKSLSKADGEGSFAADLQDPGKGELPNIPRDADKARDANWLDTYVQPLTSRLGKISMRLKGVLREFEFGNMYKANQYKAKLLPFQVKTQKLLSPEDYQMFKGYWLKQDKAALKKLLSKYDNATFTELPPILKQGAEFFEANAYGRAYEKDLKEPLSKLFDRVTPIMDELADEIRKSGREIGHIDDYLPTSVKDYEAWNDVFNPTRDVSDELGDALAKEKKFLGRDLTQTEEMDITNKYLQGFAGRPGASKPSFYKSRTGIAQEADFIVRNKAGEDVFVGDLYNDPFESLNNYIDKTVFDIGKQNFFGKGEDIDKSIGRYVSDLIKKGELNSGDAAEVKKLFEARFVHGPRATGDVVKLLKDLGYFSGLTDISSSLRQVGDLFNSFIQNGVYNTARGLGDTIADVGFKPEDIGITEIEAMFQDKSKLRGWLDGFLKASLFKRMDRFAKSTTMNAAFRKLKQQAKSSGKQFDEFYAQSRQLYGENTDQIIDGLRNAKTAKDVMASGDENVALALFNQLSDIQPVSLAEMPRAYLEQPNGRLFYALKTFMIRQFDFFRTQSLSKINDGVRKIAAGEAGGLRDVKKGVTNLGTFALLFGGGRAGTEYVIDVLNGRAEADTFSERATDGFLEIFGLSSYYSYLLDKEGIAGAAKNYFLNFANPLLDSVSDDVSYLTDVAKDKEDFDFTFLKTWRHFVPVAGKTLWSNLAGGQDQTRRLIEAKKRGSKKKKSSIRFKG